ncbi:MAG: SulP family inorganic anion transporter [bacterium]|nr:SulP family inorganic anion transporter [bacterium]
MTDTPSPAPVSSRLADIIAGISIAGLLLPEAVAYSSIANLPPQAGVIALFAGLIVYGLCGKSRFAIVSATSSSAAVLAASTAAFANGDPVWRATLAMGIIILTGVLFMVASAAKFGSLSDFIAKPVLRGFSFGLGIVIIIKQLPKVIDIHPQTSAPLFFAGELLEQIPHWNWWGFGTGAAALALLLLLSRFHRLPGAVIVIVLGIVAGQWFGLTTHGVELVGDIRLSLAAPELPQLDRTDWLRLAELAGAMMLVLYAESYSSIRGFALKHGDAFEPNRELFALGAANLVSGFFHGMPVGAGYSATSANEAAGAQSRAAGLIAALVILGIALTLLPFISLMPEPVLAAIVIYAVGHTLNLAVFKPYILWRRDRLVVVIAVIAVLLLGVLDGLLAGIAVSLALMLRRLAETRISVLGQHADGHDYVNLKHHPEAKTWPGLLIVRPETPLFFANADRMLGQLQQMVTADDSIRTVILSLEESPDLDSTSIEAVRDLAADIRARHKTLLLARLKTSARHALQHARLPGLPDSAMHFFSVDDAVCHAKSALSSATEESGAE